MGSIATLLRLVREGKRDALRALVTRDLLPARLFRKNELVIVRLVEPRPLPRALPHIEFRWAAPDDEGLLQRVRPRRKGYARDFAGGALCFLGFVSGEPAAYGWFETGTAHVSRSNAYSVRLGEAAVWAYGIEVEPRFRLTGIFHKYWVDAIPRLRERGVGRVLGSVQKDNPLSLNSHRRLGFEALYELRVLRVAGVAWHAATPMPGVELPASRGLGPWHGFDEPD